MARYKTIWERRTANFRVTLAHTMDDGDPTDMMDESLAKEVREKIASGEWANYLFRVAVYNSLGDEIGADYLGGSIYANPLEFIDHRACGRANREYTAKGQTGRCGSYFMDMLASACSDARRTFARLPQGSLRAVA